MAQALVDRLLRDDLAPGDRLPPVATLVTEYGVSLGTMREALSLLESQGVISMKPGPGGGPIVEPIDSRPMAMNIGLLLQRSRSTFREVVEARLEIEPVIARVAARKCPPGMLADLTDCIVSAEKAAQGDDEFVPHAAGFHQIVAACTGNPIFVAMAQSLHRLTQPLNPYLPYDATRHDEVITAHKELLGALQAHDGARAEQVMVRDIEEFAAHVERTDPAMLGWPVTWGVAAGELPVDR